MGVCSDGYTGVLCGNCLTGYRKNTAFECSECPSFFTNSIFMLLLIAIVMTIVGILVRVNLLSDTKSSSTYFVLLKIMVSHFQILGIIMNIEYYWPGELQSLQDGFAYFSGISQQVFSFDCFL
jgi:hypothetical protein